MKICLISPYPDIASIGIRIMSSVLKQRGFETQLIFLPNIDEEGRREGEYRYLYENRIIREVADLCEDSDLVGIGVMTNYFEGAVQLTNAIKSHLKMNIIWGGIHPTIRPEECLNYADAVCIGEGEYALLEFANKLKRGDDYFRTKNIWFKNGEHIVKNSLRPLVKNLDSLPFPDYNIETHYLLTGREIREMDKMLLKCALKRGSIASYMGIVAYQTMASRGCPHRCSYCCNDILKRLYDGEKFVRRRGVGNIIDEMVAMKTRFPFIEGFWISDDSFFATSEAEMFRFGGAYREKVGLPFSCLGSPETINEEKLGYLVDAGLRCIQMGIQTGSKKIAKDVYHRNFSSEKVLRVANSINRFKDKLLPPLYDIILDNDYEEESDIIKTIKLILELPRPYRLQLFSLVLYPGTELYSRAREDGFIYDDINQIYRKRYHFGKSTYLNFILFLLRVNVPKPFIKVLAGKKMVRIFCRNPLDKFFCLVFEFARRLKRVII